MTMVRVKFVYDDESQNWCFVIKEPSIVGGADSFPDAQEMVRQALSDELGGNWRLKKPRETAITQDYEVTSAVG